MQDSKRAFEQLGFWKKERDKKWSFLKVGLGVPWTEVCVSEV